MEAKVTWTGVGTMGFLAESGSGHSLLMDAAVEGGGKNLGPRPMELMLIGAGGCTSFDIVTILRKGRYDVRGCEVKLTAERADEAPKVFTQIHFHFVVTGNDIPESAVEKAIQLSHDKYCSASIMLAKTAKSTHSFEIISQKDIPSEFQKNT